MKKWFATSTKKLTYSFYDEKNSTKHSWIYFTKITTTPNSSNFTPIENLQFIPKIRSITRRISRTLGASSSFSLTSEREPESAGRFMKHPVTGTLLLVPHRSSIVSPLSNVSLKGTAPIVPDPFARRTMRLCPFVRISSRAPSALPAPEMVIRDSEKRSFPSWPYSELPWYGEIVKSRSRFILISSITRSIANIALQILTKASMLDYTQPWTLSRRDECVFASRIERVYSRSVR